jgi:hypothetical protein
MATLAGQRAQFTLALNQYNMTEDDDERAEFAKRMAKCISAAPHNGFTPEQVTQGQSYPAEEVAKYLNGELEDVEDTEISEQSARQALESKVDTSDVIRDGQGSGTLYVYGYRCAPDRLKIGRTEGDTILRIAEQIWTSTPDKPVLLVEIKTNTCSALDVGTVSCLPFLLSISVSKWDWRSSRNQRVTGNQSRCVFGFN